MRAIWVMLPGAMLWGASFPLALAGVAAPGQDSARLVGGVYAANTVGAIAGALITSLGMVGTVGSQITQQALIGVAAIVEGRTLSMDDARLAMGAVMDGEATPSQLAALLMGLRMRGETVDELAGFASAMRERVVRVEAPAGTIDIVGTGGDGSGTFNISTTAALIVA